MHSKYTDLYIAFLQAGPTGGHLACLKDIHESIERYLEQVYHYIQYRTQVYLNVIQVFQKNI